MWIRNLMLVPLLLFNSLPCWSATPPGASDAGCIPDGAFDREKEYFDSTSQIVPEFSQGGTANVRVANDFQVQYANHYKVLRNTRSNETTVLVLCGAPVPDPSFFPEGTHFIQVPVERYAATSTVQVGFLEMLGMLGRAEYLPAYVSSACAQKLIDTCGVGVVNFYDGSQTLYNVSAVYLDSPTPNDPRGVTFDATTDPGPLQRAEWLVFMGTFFNLDRQSSERFMEIENSYKDTKSMAQATTKTPLVAWVSYRADYGPDYPEAFIVEFDEYKMNLVEDSGAATLDKNSESFSGAVEIANDLEFRVTDFGGRKAAAEAFANAVKDVDILIDETYPFDGNYDSYDLQSLLDVFGLSSDDANMQFLSTGNVWRVDKRIGMGSDWYEGAVSRPDIVLKDMVYLSEPELLPNDYKTTFFRNIAKGEQVTLIGPQQCASTCEELRQTIPLTTDNWSRTTRACWFIVSSMTIGVLLQAA